MKSFSFALIFVVLLTMWGGIRIANHISFNQDCGGYLKRAANANTVEIATKELDRAINYLERERLTEGYTSVIYQTPDEDVSYWYQNIKAAHKELVDLPNNSSPLEKTNVLMKLRETLTDQGESGTNLTVPEGISIYPSNVIMVLMGWVSLIGTVIGVVWIAVEHG